MNKAKNAVRKILVGAVGFPLLLIGLILIPLPGPGVLISLIAFFVLSSEYSWADKGFKEAKEVLGKIYAIAKSRAAKIDGDFK